MAATLANLAPLRYARLAPRDRTAHAPPAAPAWLAHALGEPAAALAAARNLLATHTPNVLVGAAVSTPPPPRPPDKDKPAPPAPRPPLPARTALIRSAPSIPSSAPAPAVPASAPTVSPPTELAAGGVPSSAPVSRAGGTPPRAAPAAPIPPREPEVALWLFSTRDLEEVLQHPQLRELFAYFTTETSGVWLGDPAAACVPPLLCALRDETVSSLQRALRAVPLGPRDVFLPDACVMLRVSVALAPGADARIRLAAFNAPMLRRLQPADVRPPRPRPLLIAPFALRAALLPRKRVGDALAATVISRWEEAALIPKVSTDDTGAPRSMDVVFVGVGANVELPVPIVALLCVGDVPMSPKSSALAARAAGRASALGSARGKRKAGSLDKGPKELPDSTRRIPSNVWRSRKRPRSPSADMEALEARAAAAEEEAVRKRSSSSQSLASAVADPKIHASSSFEVGLGTLSGVAPPKPVLPLANSNQLVAARDPTVPTASSLNRAIAAASRVSESTVGKLEGEKAVCAPYFPVLKHPLLMRQRAAALDELSTAVGGSTAGFATETVEDGSSLAAIKMESAVAEPNVANAKVSAAGFGVANTSQANAGVDVSLNDAPVNAESGDAGTASKAAFDDGDLLGDDLGAFGMGCSDLLGGGAGAGSGLPASNTGTGGPSVGDGGLDDLGDPNSTGLGGLGSLPGLSGGGFNMDDLVVFDDDVTKFFGGNDAMDASVANVSPFASMLGMDPSPSASDPSAAGLPPSAPDPHRQASNGEVDGPSARSLPTSNGPPAAAPLEQPNLVAKVDVKAELETGEPEKPDVTDACADDGECKRGIPWVPRGLALLDVAARRERPTSPKRTEELYAFLEEDLVGRMNAAPPSLSEVSLVGVKKKAAGNRKKSLQQRVHMFSSGYVAVPGGRLSDDIAASVTDRFAPIESLFSAIKVRKTRNVKAPRDVYLPAREMRALSAMKRSRKHRVARKYRKTVAGQRLLISRVSEGSSDSEDESADSDDEENLMNAQETRELPALFPKEEHLLKDGSCASPQNGACSGGAADVPVICSQPRPLWDVTRARQVASNVAVDCAGACYVLLASLACGTTSTSLATECLESVSWLHSIAAVASPPAPLVGNVELVESTGAAAESSLSLNMSSYMRGSGRGKAENDAKAEKDSCAALVALVQMQMISAPCLMMFSSDCRAPSARHMESAMDAWKLGSLTNDARGVASSKAPSDLGHPISDPALSLSLSATVSSVMRRTLCGLPHLLNSSTIVRKFGSRPADLYGNDHEDLHAVSTNPGKLALKNMYVRGLASTESQAFDVVLPPPVEISTLPSARVCVGHGGNWIEASCGGLPFWEKTSMEPYAGAKNVQYAALAPKDVGSDVRCFFRDLSAAYEECSLGRHSPMPFDAVSMIANSVPSDPGSTLLKDPEAVTSAEMKMIQQYHLAAVGLATKLTAGARDIHKSDTVDPHYVIYVVSPFPRCRRAATAELFRAITPLVACSSSPLISGSQGTSLPSGLMSAPWRAGAHSGSGSDQNSCPGLPPMGSSATGTAPQAQATNGAVLALTVRMLPWDAMERYPIEVARCGVHPGATALRPQVVKSVAFSVYSSLRGRKLRRHLNEGDNGAAHGGSGNGEASDDLWSPMTPDVVGSPSGTIGPQSPSCGVASGDDTSSSTPASNCPPSGSDPNSSSCLYDPPFLLAGTGQNMGQCGFPGDAVFHLAYVYVEALSRYVYSWTDSRGELLDVGVFSCTSPSSPSARFRMFSKIWAKGQRWWIAFVDQTCVTVAKAGEQMQDSERDDWEAVVSKFVSTTNTRAEFPEERCESRLRFPAERASRPFSGPDVSDVLRDAATPATPASMAQSCAQTTSSGPSTSRAVESTPVDPASTTLRSVSILSVMENQTPDLFAFNVSEEAVALSTREGSSQARASLILCPDVSSRSVRQIDVELHSHFGVDSESQPTSPWDAIDAASTLKHVATNFHCLRTAASVPCWPVPHWKSVYPLHVESVLNMKNLLLNVARIVKRD